MFSKTIGCLAAAAMAAAVLQGSAKAENIGNVDGLWVMKKAEDRYEGDDVVQSLELVLERLHRNKPDRPKTMRVKWMGKDYGKDEKVIIHFYEPKFVAGVTLFTVIKPYEDDNRFLYVPEVNRIRRVSASDEYSNFMGTDFTYFDLSEREPDEENHRLLGMEELDGRTCYVVETTPKQMVFGSYAKRVTWVDKDRFTKQRIKYWDMGGRYMKQYDTFDWEKIDGVWTAGKLVMEDVLHSHRTSITRSDVKYNNNPPDEWFEPASVDRFVFDGEKVTLLPFEERPTKIWEERAKRNEEAKKRAEAEGGKR